MTMSIVTLADAKLHLRVTGGDEDTLIQAHINAAEQLAASWMGRTIFADQNALNTARAAVPAELSSATTTYVNAVDAANALGSDAEICIALSAAEHDYQRAQTTARMTHSGVVINDLIKSAVLLTVGALYADRETAEPPTAAQNLLQPHKLYG